MATEPSIKNAYDLWCEIQNEIYINYQDTMPEPLPLSKQKEFKSIKNMIIGEVLKLNFEMEQDEQRLVTDEETDSDFEKSLEFLQLSSKQGNQFTKYQLGMLYLKGEDVKKDIGKAILFLTDVANTGNQISQYQLGKLYLLGKDIERDKETAIEWFTLSAEQGNEYAQFFIDNFDNWNNPSVGICAMKLFSHMSRLFEDTVPHYSTTAQQKVDSKLLRKMREKKHAHGHKISGHIFS